MLAEDMHRSNDSGRSLINTNCVSVYCVFVGVKGA